MQELLRMSFTNTPMLMLLISLNHNNRAPRNVTSAPHHHTLYVQHVGCSLFPHDEFYYQPQLEDSFPSSTLLEKGLTSLI